MTQQECVNSLETFVKNLLYARGGGCTLRTIWLMLYLMVQSDTGEWYTNDKDLIAFCNELKDDTSMSKLRDILFKFTGIKMLSWLFRLDADSPLIVKYFVCMDNLHETCIQKASVPSVGSE